MALLTLDVELTAEVARGTGYEYQLVSNRQFLSTSMATFDQRLIGRFGGGDDGSVIAISRDPGNANRYVIQIQAPAGSGFPSFAMTGTLFKIAEQVYIDVCYEKESRAAGFEGAAKNENGAYASLFRGRELHFLFVVMFSDDGIIVGKIDPDGLAILKASLPLGEYEIHRETIVEIKTPDKRLVEILAKRDGVFTFKSARRLKNGSED